MSDPRYPDVTVQLTGVDGNALMVIGLVQRELRRSGHADRVADFTAEATSGDFSHLISTVADWVHVA